MKFHRNGKACNRKREKLLRCVSTNTMMKLNEKGLNAQKRILIPSKGPVALRTPQSYCAPYNPEVKVIAAGFAPYEVLWKIVAEAEDKDTSNPTTTAVMAQAP